MFSTLTSLLLLCLYLQFTFSKELASDKESLKNSLVQVDQFLEKVGQRIQNERNFLHTAGSGKYSSPTGTVTAEGVSNEDYSALWFGGKRSIQNNRNKENLPQREQSGNFDHFSNFAKAFATFRENEGKESTKKLINAVADLKGLVEHNIAEVKNEQPDNPNEANRREILRQIKETLKKREEKSKLGARTPKLRKSDGINDDTQEGFDIFKDVEFPEKSEFPFSVATKTTETTNTLPDILSPGFITKGDSGPGADLLTTPSTTTDSDEELLNPKEFGYTTTHKPLSTFGDVGGSPFIDPRYLTTKPPDSPFVASLKKDMTKFGMGVFSIAVLKVFHMVIWKKGDDVKSLVWAFRRVIENKITFNHLRDFGEVTRKALDDMSIAAYRMPYDQLRTDAIMLHHALLHRREMFSADINYIMDELDSMYTTKESNELLKSLQPLDQFSDPKITPFTLVDKMVTNFLAPFKRMSGAPRREGLIIAITKAVKAHFYVTQNIAKQAERRSAPKKPLEVHRPTVNKEINKIYWDKMKSWNPNKFSTLSENTMNLTTDLQNIYDNIIKTEVSNANKVNDDSKPRAIFRTGENYVDDRVIPPASNNSVFDDGFNVLDMDNMYRDYKENLVSEVPVTDVVGIRMNDNRMVNDNIMIEVNRKKPDNVPNVQKFDQENYPMPTVSQTESPTVDLKMVSESKRHHRKRHHRKHRHHMTLRQKLAKIKRIMKLYRSGTHNRRFRHRHHHRHNKRKALKSLDIRPETNPPVQPLSTRRIPRNVSKLKPINDKRFQVKKAATTTKQPNSRPSNVEYYRYTTQVYEVKDKFNRINTRRKNKFNTRRKFNDELKKLIDMSFVRRANEGSDEEISLKSNLYKAMDLGARSQNQLFLREGGAKRNAFLRESSGSDEEALLKNKIYNYFNNIQSN